MAGVPPDQLTGAGATFVTDFNNAYHPDALDPYTPYAAAETQVLLNAIQASDGTRASITSHLFGVQVTGSVLGNFAINTERRHEPGLDDDRRRQGRQAGHLQGADAAGQSRGGLPLDMEATGERRR